MGVEVCTPSGSTWLSPALGLLDPPEPPVEGLAYDWSDTNLPMAYTVGTAPWEAKLPASTPVVNLSSTGATFWDRLNNTQNAQSGRFICRLPAGRHMLTSFRPIPSNLNYPGSDDYNPLYSFGFWFPKLAGFVGPGWDVCSVELAANSMNADQLAAIAARPLDFNPSLIGFCRFDGTTASPVYLGGLTIRAADQQFTDFSAAVKALDSSPVYGPQPAPHNGVVLYQNAPGIISYVNFEAAGRACLPRPPFEHANIGSQYGDVRYDHVNFDGRRAAIIDPARPQRCAPVMGNNESYHELVDCWVHDSNISRYAVNDENRDTSGPYNVTRVKAERISSNYNRDPAINGGQSLGGYSPASCFGWESTNSTITVRDPIVTVSNDDLRWGGAKHFDITTVGHRNAPGGRFYCYGGTFRSPAWPTMDGYLLMRVTALTYFWTDGLNNTVFIYDANGVRKQPYIWTSGAWPPTQAMLDAAGATRATHYIVRNN